jgi:hypothetical protein
MMTGNATVLTRGNAAARTRENREYVAVCSKSGSPGSPLRWNQLHGSSCETTGTVGASSERSTS